MAGKNSKIQNVLNDAESEFGVPYGGSLTSSNDNHAATLIWLKEYKKYIPIPYLVDGGSITDEEADYDLFKLYSCGVALGHGKLFRKTPQTKNDEDVRKEVLQTTWASLVMQKAKQLELPKYDRKLVVSSLLEDLVRMSQDPDNLTHLFKYLSGFGIGLVVVPCIAGSRIDGMAALDGHGNPIVGLSLRYDRLDYFWFTLLHEAAHVIYHFDRLESAIIDNFDEVPEEEFEQEANYYAREAIIPRAIWRSSDARRVGSEEDIMVLAHELKIHPSLVVGRLHYDSNNYAHHRNIVDEFSIRELLKDHI